MMRDIEINFVVSDSLNALETYREIFEVDILEVTNFPQGSNEAIFTIYGMKFHMLDENAEYGLIAPSGEIQATIWFNVTVPNIMQTHHNALRRGCVELQAVTPMLDYGVSNSLFKDPFGYLWMLHEQHGEVADAMRDDILAEVFE